MTKIRVYELARELDRDNKSLEEVIKGLGIPIKNYMSTLTPEEALRVRSAMAGGSTRASGSASQARGASSSGARPSTPASGKPQKRRPESGGGGGGGVIVRKGGADVRRRRAEAEEAAAQVAARADESARPPMPRRDVPGVRPAVARPGGAPTPARPVGPGVVARPGTTAPSTGPVVRPGAAATRPQPSTGPSPVAVRPAAEAQRPAVEPRSEASAQADTGAATSTAPHVQGEPARVADARPAAADVRAPAGESTEVRAPSEPPRPEPPRDRVQTIQSVAASDADAPAHPDPSRAAAVASRPSEAAARSGEATRPVAVPRPSDAPASDVARAGAPTPAADRSGRAEAPHVRPAASTPAAEGPRGPAVGTRIELPKGSRRLPGGMASRMTEDRQGAPADTGPQVRRSEPGRPPRSDDRPQVRAEGASVGDASRGGAPGVAVEAARQGGARPIPPRPIGTEGGAEGAAGAGRRVVRNEEGVIVGAASQRSEPKILGFIPLAQTRRKQQVIITDAADQERRGRASQRKQREERAQAQGRRKPPRRTGRGQSSGPPKISTVEMSEEKKRIRVDEAIQVSDLAHQMGQKASHVLRTLWGMGLRGLTINHAIDYETAELVAAEFGYTVENVSFQETEYIEEAADEGETRAPVVTVMGHVDHGKTSLLDYIRNSRVAAGEAGGITQHVGAYRVSTKRGDVVFLDTPGHEAFTAMRERGAQVTDLVVLVVAADDGVMPTTIEAINHAREAKVPIIVALNKMDKPDANPGRVKQALMEQSIVGEEFGGDTPIVEVSAKTGQGIDELLETLALQAEVLELRAPHEGRARGVVLEARIDKGRGTVVTVLVQSGQIQHGDILVASEHHGKVRGLYEPASGKKLKSAGPSTPVEVLGLSGVPSAGDLVNVVENERDAKALVAHRREQRKRKESVRTGPSIQELLKRKKQPVLKVVLKADVQGSAQAVAQALEELTTEKVKLEVVKAEVGQINETDVKYASAGDAVIFGFNVKTAGKASSVADAEGVPIHTFSVIYEATDKAKELMVGLLEPEYRQREQGEAEVRALFPIPRLGVVAGCRVVRGIIQRSSHVRVVRDGDVLHDGTIASLRIHKDDVREVKDGFECGIVVDGFTDVREGDHIQAYEVEAIPPTL